MREIQVLSLGAGVQSTTMLLMACHGELTPKPDLVVFSDTGWEPEAVYKHVDELKTLVKKRFGIEITITNNGNIKTDIEKAARWKTRVANMPYYVKSPDGDRGIIPRGCSDEYKIAAINKAVRKHLGMIPKQRMKHTVIKWLGISTDEIHRAKTSSGNKWEVLRYPLIEKTMNRLDCMNWLERNGYKVPPKSACIGCPFHSDHAWLELKRNYPNEWNEAVDFEKVLHEHGLREMRGKPFLHRSCVPLEEVELNEDQLELDFDGFGNECSGHCAV